mmetsp:Transcript_74011/g.239272  ORF Transcript_74011/g.239272 Transcript_74011/m.239272 type:complete len:322 (-) Transcript_74011:121-1086(-)
MAEPVKPGFITGAGSRAMPRARLLPSGMVVDFVLTISTIAVGVGLIFGVAQLTWEGLIDKQTFTTILSIACPLVTMVQFVSPTPVVMDAIRKMSSSSLPTPVFQSQAACNILGLAYGIQIANGAVLITNMFGLGCQILYLASDHYVRSPNSGWLFFAVKLCVLFDLGLYVFATVAPINTLGHTITVFNIILFAVPLTKLGSILRTRNASSLPTAMTCISVVNNAVWSLFGLMIEDIVVLFPSVLGFCLSSFQVLVILWCQGSLPFDLGFLLLACRGSREAVLPVTSQQKPGFEEEDLPLHREQSRTLVPSPKEFGKELSKI